MRNIESGNSESRVVSASHTMLLGRYIQRVGYVDAVLDKTLHKGFTRKVTERLMKVRQERKKTAQEIFNESQAASMSPTAFFDLVASTHRSQVRLDKDKRGVLSRLQPMLLTDEGDVEYAPFAQKAIGRLREDVSDLEERKTPEEISKEHYVKATVTFARICEHVSGIPIPERVLNAWITSAQLLRTGDAKLDTIPVKEERQELVGKVVSYFKGETELEDVSLDSIFNSELKMLKRHGDELDISTRAELFRGFERLVFLSEKVRGAATISEFIAARAQEGEALVDMFLMQLPAEYKESKNYLKLEKGVKRLMRAANIFDSFIDFESDYRQGSSSMRPSKANRAMLLAHFSKEAVAALRYIRPSRSLSKHLFEGVRATAENNTGKESNRTP